MPATLKVTISLPVVLHRAAERARKARRQTRSQFFRIALEAVLSEEQQREAVERYVRGYQEQPEGGLEVSAAKEMSRRALAEEPWE